MRSAKQVTSAFVLGFAMAVSAVANADLVRNFRTMEGTYKGPFDQNVAQGTRSKIGVLKGSPAGTHLFDAAYRNSIGEKLANEDGFYIGNLFTTNYYQLMGEYVYGDAHSDHDLNHQALVDVTARAMPKASAMVRHWVLEKHYVHQFPKTRLGGAFQIRGISDMVYEIDYAKHFLNFFINGMTDDMQFLTAALLAKASPLVGSNSLERARNLITAEYDRAKANYGEKSTLGQRMYALRNAVHNQISHLIIGQIDTFMRDFPQYRGNRALTEIQQILRDYYAVSARRVVEAAKRIGAQQVEAAAMKIQNEGATAQNCLELSNAVADLRSNIQNSAVVPYGRKTEALVTLNAASGYLNKELSLMKNVASKEVLKTVINLIYIEGFLIKDNWQYFVSEIDGAADVDAAAAQLPDIIGIASDTLTQAFSPAFDQWLLIQPKMEYFMDNTIKSSSMNTASIIADKLRK